MLIVPNFTIDTTNRSHPWSVTQYTKGGGRYYDFTSDPDLIPKVLEDFLPFADRPSTQHFYSFLRWINGPDTHLETNDCAFRGPMQHQDTIYRFKLKSDGRVDLFYRDHIFNTQRNAKSFRWLIRMLCFYLQLAKPDFRKGHIGVSIMQTHYLLVPETDREGQRISLLFNAYGDTEAEVFESLFIVFDGIFEASKRVSSGLGVDVPKFP